MMSEQQPQQEQPPPAGRDSLWDIAGDQLVREAVGTLVILAVVWYLELGGRTQVRALIGHIRRRLAARAGRIDAEVARFRAQVTEWDHQQRQQPSPRPRPEDGGCGCG
jgi:hypothetical protein